MSSYPTHAGSMLSRAAVVARHALLVVAILSVAACSRTEHGQKTAGVNAGGSPLVVCGTTLAPGLAGPELFEATGAHLTITGQSGARLYIRLVSGCTHGAVVVITPVSAAHIVRQAPAHDGRMAAVVLLPRRTTFEVRIVRSDGGTGIVRVRLTPSRS